MLFDRVTDGIGVVYTALSIASRAKKDSMRSLTDILQAPADHIGQNGDMEVR